LDEAPEVMQSFFLRSKIEQHYFPAKQIAEKCQATTSSASSFFKGKIGILLCSLLDGSVQKWIAQAFPAMLIY